MRERLRALLLFADLDDEQLDILAGGATEFSAAAGKPLIQRGDPGSGVFVLEEGRAVGERTARVRAVTDVRAIAIPRPELERVIATHPQLGERLRHVS